MGTALATLTILLATAGAWAALAQLVTVVPPDRPLALPVFYGLLFGALSGSSALVAWLLRRPRSVDGQLRSPLGYLGHAMLLASIVEFCLWLQSLRMLSPTVAALLIGLYVCLELALVFGTRGGVDIKVPSRFAPETGG